MRTTDHLAEGANYYNNRARHFYTEVRKIQLRETEMPGLNLGDTFPNLKVDTSEGPLQLYDHFGTGLATATFVDRS